MTTSGRRRATRPRTLTATLESSYTLLAPHEQTALTALAVFPGGCTLEAAKTVTGAPFEALEALVDDNPVVAPQLADGPGRLTMLETVRECVRGRLAQRPDAGDPHRRHCDYFPALAERSMSELRRSDAPAPS